MKVRPTILVATVVAIALTAASLVPALAGAKGSGAKIELHNTKLGKILVNSRGFTIYAFTPDGRNKDRCAAIRQCLAVWPVVATSGRPIAGPGVKQSLLGTIKVGHKTQVTYAGHPLYTYVGDFHAAQTTYVNILQFHGRWPALNASGKEVK
jgi:predicted lipoprotein with Yx(FWY)xxD motif